MKKLLISSMALVLVAGCTNVSGRAIDAVAETNKAASTMTDHARAPYPSAKPSQVRVLDKSFVGGSAVENRRGDRLPPNVHGKKVTMVSASRMNLLDIGSLITDTTGVAVSYAPEIIRALSPKSDNISSAPVNPLAVPPPAPSEGESDKSFADQLQSLPPSNTGAALSIRGAKSDKMKVNYTGSLEGFLSQVAGFYNIAWEYKSGKIRFYRYITKTFTFNALPTQMKMEGKMTSGLGNAGGGSGSGSNQTTSGVSQTSSNQLEIDIWKEVNDSLKQLVNGTGYAIASPSTSSITVTAPIDVMTQVENYIDHQNDRLGREVAVSVKVYNVSLTDSEAYNFDVQGVFNNGTVSSVLGNVVSGALSPVSGNGNGFNIGIIDPNSKYAGSEAFLQALSSRGDVSVVTSAAVTTMSGVPVPLQVSNTRNYVSEVSTTVDQGVSQTSFTPGTVNTGFSLMLTPQVHSSGQIMMQYGVTISELVGKNDGFDNFNIGNLTVQLPNINQRSFVQQALVQDRSSLVLAGFEQVRNTSNKSGVGDPDFIGLGGSRNATIQRDLLVIVITPTVVKTKPISVASVD